jgi:hypothetical protein
MNRNAVVLFAMKYHCLFIYLTTFLVGENETINVVCFLEKGFWITSISQQLVFYKWLMLGITKSILTNASLDSIYILNRMYICRPICRAAVVKEYIMFFLLIDMLCIEAKLPIKVYNSRVSSLNLYFIRLNFHQHISLTSS